MQRPSTNSSKHWFKPNAGIIKVNSDANLANTDRWGLGATFRDSDGELVAAATWEVPGANDPMLAEAFAIYLAMTMAIDCCFQDVEFESDNKGLFSLSIRGTITLIRTWVTLCGASNVLSFVLELCS
jgi:hypothetical protein